MSELHKFLFEGLPVRGMLVRLTDSWREVLQRRERAGDSFPAPVQRLLGEMAAAAVLMQSGIRFKGALVLQLHGDGPLRLAVAEVQDDLAFRVTAKVVGEVGAGATLQSMLNARGQGRCAITLDPADKRAGQLPYQGVVPLHGDRREPLERLADVLEHYMLQSEQLDTKLVLAANAEAACGLLIQRLPVEGAGNLGAGNEDEIGRSEPYHRIAQLAATLGSDELLTLDADAILHRLFWQEDVRRFEPQSGDAGPRFACRCTRERVGQMLRSLGRPEVESIVSEQGRVEIACDFCGKKYHYDAVDAAGLFTPAASQAPGSASLN